ncbi:hypothetical protein HrrHc1_110 [Halorubrum phage Hardycor1]|nr:hypothetical protein HrrHc1_110 [Halorubrum phage Hardycor1]
MNAHDDDTTDENRATTDGGTASRGRDAPPEDAVASIDDFRVERDADGTIRPVWEPLPGTESYVRVRPLAQGDANEYLPEHGDPRGLDDDEILTLLREFYVEPSFDEVDSVDDLTAFGVDPLLMALMNASGFDYASGMIADSNDLVEAVQGNSSRGN